MLAVTVSLFIEKLEYERHGKVALIEPHLKYSEETGPVIN